MAMDGHSSKARLTNALLEAFKKLPRGEAAVAPSTPHEVERLLRLIHEREPQAATWSDEMVLVWLLKSAGVEITDDLIPPELQRQKLIDEGMDLVYGKKYSEARRVLVKCEQLSREAEDVSRQAWARQYLGRIERDS